MTDILERRSFKEMSRVSTLSTRTQPPPEGSSSLRMAASNEDFPLPTMPTWQQQNSENNLCVLSQQVRI